MNIKEKSNLEYNPKRKYFIYTFSKKTLKKYFRNSSSNYIKKKSIRNYIFKRDNFSCQICGSKKRLQIDHIISVYQATLENIRLINNINNLRTLCCSCNARRSPDEQ